MTRRQQKNERKKLEILQSAAQVFRRKGYYPATMEDISERLLMTKGSLYYYFKNKEEIFYQCQEYVLDKLLQGLRGTEVTRQGSEERLRYLVQNHIRVITDELSGSVLHLDFDLLSPPLLDAIIRKRDQYEKGIRRVIQQGIQQKVFRRCDVKFTTFAILGALNWVSKWYSPEGGAKSETISAALADYLVGGLMNPTGAASEPETAGRAARNDSPRKPDRVPLDELEQESNLAEESWLL